MELDFVTENKYQVYSTTKEIKWQEAAEYCLSIGARLMQLETELEFYRAEKFRVEAFSGNNNGNLWLDGRRVRIDGQLVWQDYDGYPISLNNDFWRENRPEEDNAVKCLAYTKDAVIDVNCATKKFAVCEYRPTASKGKVTS